MISEVDKVQPLRWHPRPVVVASWNLIPHENPILAKTLRIMNKRPFINKFTNLNSQILKQNIPNNRISLVNFFILTRKATPSFLLVSSPLCLIPQLIKPLYHYYIRHRWNSFQRGITRTKNNAQNEEILIETKKNELEWPNLHIK